jgi:pimeloyl-ACP methyl ester carboxylesterase
MALDFASMGDEDGSDQLPSDMITAGRFVYFGKKGRPGMPQRCSIMAVFSLCQTEHVEQRWQDTHPFRPSNKPLLKKIYSSVLERKPLEVDEWKKIAMPVLIIHGGKYCRPCCTRSDVFLGDDIPYPPESARQNYVCLSEADRELHIIEGGAHLLSWTEAADVNDLFIAFLQKKAPTIQS